MGCCRPACLLRFDGYGSGGRHRCGVASISAIIDQLMTARGAITDAHQAASAALTVTGEVIELAATLGARDLADRMTQAHNTIERAMEQLTAGLDTTDEA